MYMFVSSVRRYQSGNQNPYIEEEQTTQWPKENKQNCWWLKIASLETQIICWIL